MNWAESGTTAAGVHAAPAQVGDARVPLTMRAVVQDRYGGPEILRVATEPVPTIGPDEVLLRVEAAGVDRGTWHLLRGLPFLARAGCGLRGPRRVPGLDVAGTVVRIGSAEFRISIVKSS